MSSRTLKTFWIIPGVLLLAQVLLYSFAPCGTFFDGWQPPRLFFGIVWQLLLPAILAMAVTTRRSLRKGRVGAWQWLVWVFLGLLIGWGWIDGYILAVISWRATPGMPWPDFC
jgi:hypothetical protein